MKRTGVQTHDSRTAGWDSIRRIRKNSPTTMAAMRTTPFVKSVYGFAKRHCRKLGNIDVSAADQSVA